MILRKIKNLKDFLNVYNCYVLASSKRGLAEQTKYFLALLTNLGYQDYRYKVIKDCHFRVFEKIYGLEKANNSKCLHMHELLEMVNPDIIEKSFNFALLKRNCIKKYNEISREDSNLFTNMEK